MIDLRRIDLKGIDLSGIDLGGVRMGTGESGGKPIDPSEYLKLDEGKLDINKLE